MLYAGSGLHPPQLLWVGLRLGLSLLPYLPSRFNVVVVIVKVKALLKTSVHLRVHRPSYTDTTSPRLILKKCGREMSALMSRGKAAIRAQAQA